MTVYFIKGIAIILRQHGIGQYMQWRNYLDNIQMPSYICYMLMKILVQIADLRNIKMESNPMFLMILRIGIIQMKMQWNLLV